MTERDIAKLLKLPTSYRKTPNYLTMKLLERARTLITMGHVEKELAVELLKNYIYQLDNQYSGMAAALKESGMNAVISILEGDEEYGHEDMNIILEFLMRVGHHNIDSDLKQALGSAVNRTCYRNDQYSFPLLTKATLLKLPEVQVDSSV